MFGCPPVNYMTSYFCGTSSECSDPPDYKTFVRAQRNLVQQCVEWLDVGGRLLC